MIATMELDTDISSDLSFAELLASYDYIEPKRGQLLSGVIVSKSRDLLTLDVGLKRDAFVMRQDLERLPSDFITGLRPGQEVQVFVLTPHNEDGEMIVSLNKALELDDWKRADEMLASAENILVEVADSNKGGLLARFGRLMGFIPNSHIESLAPTLTEERADAFKRGLVGRTLRVKVIQVEQQRNRLVLSERAARREDRRERLAELKVGDIVTGQVVNITDFGVFVDIGGVDGMVHISNLDHRHVTHPRDVVAIGDSIQVRIDGVDTTRERISLNRKAALPDPWTMFTSRYTQADLMEGIVTNVVDYGVFVAAPGGAQGLVHVSRMESLRATPKDMFKEGDAVLVRIVKIDPERKQIELSIDEVPQEAQVAWLYRQREVAREDIIGREDAPPAA